MSDVLIIGAGAAGLMCALEAGKRGRRVTVLDHAAKPAEKIRISGGGRCNFTNLHTSPANYLSQNPRFCVSALRRYTPQDFVAMVRRHGIAFHEKTLGQLFCDDSSQQIIDMLLAECAAVGVRIRLNAAIASIEKTAECFAVQAGGEMLQAASLVVACGGLSIPKMGASGFGYSVARQFGHNIVPTEAALVPFTLGPQSLNEGLSGLSVSAEARIGKQMFREGMLFTHRGLSGPSILQISSYWQPGAELRIDLAPGCDVTAMLLEAKRTQPRQEILTALSIPLPRRLAETILRRRGGMGNTRLADAPNKLLESLARDVNDWHAAPSGTEGYRTAEVTRGGVDTSQISSKTMESALVPGLYFIGEVVDVTGHLGGFNFQWAWSSGYAAGQFV